MAWHRLRMHSTLIRAVFAAAVLLCGLRGAGAQPAYSSVASGGDTGRGSVTARASASIVRQHRADAWSVLSVQAEHTPGENGGEGGGEGIVSVYFPDTVDQQYVRRIWVPEGGQRLAFLHFRMPAGIPQSQGSIELQMASIEVGEGER